MKYMNKNALNRNYNSHTLSVNLTEHTPKSGHYSILEIFDLRWSWRDKIINQNFRRKIFLSLLCSNSPQCHVKKLKFTCMWSRSKSVAYRLPYFPTVSWFGSHCRKFLSPSGVLRRASWSLEEEARLAGAMPCEWIPRQGPSRAAPFSRPGCYGFLSLATRRAGMWKTRRARMWKTRQVRRWTVRRARSFTHYLNNWILETIYFTVDVQTQKCQLSNFTNYFYSLHYITDNPHLNMFVGAIRWPTHANLEIEKKSPR